MRDFISRVYNHLSDGKEAPSDATLTVDSWTENVGNAYLSTNDESVKWFYHWQTFATEVKKQFDILTGTITFDFSPNDPVNPETGLPDMLYLRRLLTETGTMPVYTGDSDHPILSRIITRYNGQLITANDMFRAVHDVLGHFDSDSEFNFVDEIKAYRHHYRTFSTHARIALFCETMGQLTAGRVSGNFPAQKCLNLTQIIPGYI